MLSRLTPSTIVAILAAALTLAAAFGLPITQDQQDAILAVGLSVSTILLAHGISGALSELAPQTVVGLAGYIVGLLLAFGLPITVAQQTDILELTGLVATLLLGHGIAHTVKGYNSVGTAKAKAKS